MLFRAPPITRTTAEIRPYKGDEMTTIKATCPICGEVDLTADDILLRIGAAEGSNTYAFNCPTCAEFIEKPADERIVRLLLSGGVLPTLIHVPAEALEPKSGPPICHDDILEFHELLQNDDWVEHLAGPKSGDVPA
jgi:predicted RNA-binding Zn-ribbon protein involved in translation (DUF1610 family)